MSTGNELTGNEKWNELPPLRWAPPQQNNPIVYEINSTAARLIKAPEGRDIIVQRAPGFTGTIKNLEIFQGGDVRVIGLKANHIEVKDITGSVYFEGVHVDAPANADGIEIGPRYLPTGAPIIFNRVHIEGISGSFNGFHADGIQIWASNKPVNVFVDQSYIESNYQGVIFASLKTGSKITISRSSVESYNGTGAQAWQMNFGNGASPRDAVFLDEVWANPKASQDGPKWGDHASPSQYDGGEWNPATEALTWPDLYGVYGVAYSKLGDLPDWAPVSAVGSNHPRTGLSNSYFTNNTYVGTHGNDVKNGTALGEYFETLEGNDVVNAGAGDDILRGDSGSDQLRGGAGQDTLIGGYGNDTLTGDTSSDGLSAAAGSEQGDLIHGGDGTDFIDGGVGHDELHGEAGNDTVNGSAGNDFVTGGAGADFLNGGDGNDTVLGSGTRVEFVWETESSWKSTFGYYDPATDKGKILLPNTDAHTGALNFETVLNVPAGVEFFVVPDGYNQTFASGKILAGQNGVMREIEVVYSGGAYKIRDVETGNFLRGKFQNGAVKEGAYYSDVDLNIDNKDHEKYVDGKTKWNTAYNAPGYPDDLVFNIKDVDLGGSGNDTIYGGNGSDVLDGGGGNDKLFGDAGSDVFILSPGSGNDTVGDYADGADKIYVANSFSQISITSQSGGTLVKLGSDSLFLSGVAKSKVTSGDFILKPEGLPISGPSGDSANTGLLVNQITGTSGADALVGTAAADNIQGYAGNDRLDGLAGNDSLFGGAGDDTLLGQVGDDFIDGGADYDRVWYGGPFADFAITFNGTTGFFEYIGTDPSFAGTDTIVNVERFGFGDTSYSINDLKAQTGGSSSPPAITSDWFETFDDLSDGATKDTGDTAWSTDVSSAKINPIHGVTAGEYMFSQGSGPDQDDSFITWRSESIIFENVTDLEISFDLASSQGGNGMENSGSLHDFFQLFAIVDGGAPQLLLDQNGNVSGGSNSFKFTGITGREVEIEIHAKTTGSNEAYLLDDVHVSGDADLLI